MSTPAPRRRDDAGPSLDAESTLAAAATPPAGSAPGTASDRAPDPGAPDPAEPDPAEPDPAEPDPAAPDPAAPDAGASASLEAAVDELIATDLDALDDAGIRSALACVQHACDRLEAFKLKAAGALESRAIRREGAGRESRAVRDTREFLTDRLRLTSSEAKRAGRTGRELQEAPAVQAALEDGTLRPEHAAVITDTLRHTDPDTRREIEPRLIDAGRRENPTRLGRTARRLVAREDPAATRRSRQRAHARRYARMADLPDGSLLVNARFAPGEQAETIRTWAHAHHTPDAHGDHRSPEQAMADAIVVGARAGLDAGTSPSQHGLKPHVLVLVRLEDLLDGAGTGEAAWTGPIPVDELRRLCRDAELSTVVVDAEHVPLTVSEGRRTVNRGLWKALLARDGGCRWPGCTAPPAWCDVAHGQVPDRAGGRLEPANALLLCRRHHRRVDTGWTIRIRGPAISFHPPDGGDPVRAGPPHER